MNDNQVLPACESARPLPPTQPGPAPQILVVDDDPFIRHLSAEILIRHGYEVNAVEDGVAGWEALNADNYDLLITDQNMPKVSGVELLKLLRAARMALPVIMATGTLPADEFARHPWLQPAATLLKPFTDDELLRTVKQVLHATGSAREPMPPPPHTQSQPAIEGLRRW